ncbi:MAG TPA: serine hydrolase domain-containing protein [Thermoanaerobaculia bacterium]|nr:serine hydrolase domain-containing protein [Thermoanaerobaculia bacterium]
MNGIVVVIVALLVVLVVGFGARRLSTAHAASPPLPDSLAEQRIAAYLQAVNSGKTEELRELLATHFDPKALRAIPIETRIGNLKRLAAEAGRLELVSLTPVKKREIVAVVKRVGSDARFSLTFFFAPGKERRLVGARIQRIEDDSAAPSPELAGGPLSVAGARQAIEADLARLVEQDRFSGAVLAAHKGATLFAHAYGFADRERKLSNTLDTKFNLGSINKDFTKLAIAQLAEGGKLSLSERLVHYLPDYPNPEVARRVTIEQLASHTSGLGDIFTERFSALRHELTSLPAYLELFADEPLAFAPGTKSRYSNAGYVVLGLVIERVSGVDYYSYVRQHIYAPAGMKDTDSSSLAEAVPNRAIGYTGGEENGSGKAGRPNDDLLPARGSSAGGGYSTVGDLARFAQALSENRLASPEWTYWVGGGPVPVPGTAAAAPPPISFGIAGGSPGENALLELGRDRSLVVVLSNYDPPSAEQVGKRIRTIIGRIQG